MTDRTDRTGPPIGGSPVTIAGAPAIRRLRFRTCRGPSDAEAVAAVLNAELAADGIDELYSAAAIAAEIEHPGNELPARDFIVAEVGGAAIAYARRRWTDRGEVRVFEHQGHVDPAWRRHGLGRALLRHQAASLHEVASEQAHDGETALGSYADERNVAATALLASEGYRPVRWYIDMDRPSIDPLEDAPTPDGLRMAAPDPADRRLLTDLLVAEEEAFRDHWGHHAESPDEPEAMLADPDADPSLWRVAWDGDAIAGLVRPIVYADENERFGRRRVWIDRLSVRRPWRRRGLGRALLVAGLLAGRERGMTSAGLGVDTDNTTGALGMYERLGFVRGPAVVAYRKPLVVPRGVTDGDGDTGAGRP
jgi:mycothiol synthase